MKEYVKRKQSSQKGEAFFEYLLADYAIANKVSTARDIGIDYYCEWLSTSKGTGILFAVQLKTVSAKYADVTPRGLDTKLNGLEQYEILTHGKQIDFEVDDKTIEYWRSFEIPVYLFLAVINTEDTFPQMYYQRYTPFLHKDTSTLTNILPFYKVNKGMQFLATSTNNELYFARDLYMDYVRCAYKRGQFTLYKKPAEFSVLREDWNSDNPIYSKMIEKEYMKEAADAIRVAAKLDMLLVKVPKPKN